MLGQEGEEGGRARQVRQDGSERKKERKKERLIRR